MRNRFIDDDDAERAVKETRKTSVSKVSVVDYDILEINGNTREKLISYEGELIKGMEQYIQSSAAIGEALYKAQKELADHKGGTFVKWFGQLGLQKNFVYRMIDRYSVHSKYKNHPKIEKLSIASIQTLKKLGDDVEEAEVIEALESENANKKIQELKDGFSQVGKTKICPQDHIEEAEIVYADEEKEAAKIRISEIDTELQELERRREHLIFERDMLSKRI